MLRFLVFIMVLPLYSACSQQAYVETRTPIEPTLTSWEADQPPRGVVLALHSFGDYHAAFDQLRPRFAEAGLLLDSYDQAGFGSCLQQGHWPGEQRLVEDAVQRIDHLYQAYQRPVFVLGESMGGAVAILAAQQRPDKVAGLVLAAPAVREGIRLRYGWNAAIATVAAIAPGYRVTVNRDPDDPSLAPANARRLARDALVMRQVRLDTYWGLIQLADTASNQAASPAYPELPVMLLYGGKDNTVPQAGIDALRRHFDPHLCWQFQPQAPHLLLQGNQWQATAQRIIDWIQQQEAGIGPSSTLQMSPDCYPVATDDNHREYSP